MLDQPHTVQEVTDRIRGLFDSDPVLADIWIAGEVIESTTSRSGHVFFTLSGEASVLRCVMFRMNALRQRTLPSSGASYTAHGKIEVYPTDGTYQFYVDLVEEAGIGLAALELELLRQQLEAEGLFADSRKRAIPRNPAVVGVVTSSAGAVWHDIQNIVRRRHPFVRLKFASAAVQGENAPADIVAALNSLLMNELPDVIIIARGGGSVSDLAVFNDENLVRAVFAAPVPVISAIGHETDWTLLDLVADLRAPTPSAAAELVTPFVVSDLRSILDRINSHITRFERERATRMLDVEQLRVRLEQQRTADRRERVRVLHERLARASAVHRDRAEERFSRSTELLEALSPAKTLERGYAFVETLSTGAPVRSVTNVAVGDTLRARFIDGSVDALVVSTT